MAKRAFALYGGRDPRELPAYGLHEAAHYLRIPKATLRSWVIGRYYPTASGQGFFRPIVVPPQRVPIILSFFNLVEAHVLDAIRREHKVALRKVRSALTYMNTRFPSKRPLAEQRFETDGLDLFVERYGQLENISQEGQFAMRDLLKAHLRRVEHDAAGIATRLYPYTRKREKNEPRVIVMDPFVSFGRPVLAGTGIVTAIVAERYKAGETIDELADDYGRARSDIEEAIRCELQLEAA